MSLLFGEDQKIKWWCAEKKDLRYAYSQSAQAKHTTEPALTTWIFPFSNSPIVPVPMNSNTCVIS